MTLPEQLQHDIAALPESAQGMVAEFVAFLKHRYGATATVSAGQQVPESPDMASLLEQLAAANPFQAVANPVTWQREQRTERDLPLRDL